MTESQKTPKPVEGTLLSVTLGRPRALSQHEVISNLATLDKLAAELMAHDAPSYPSWGEVDEDDREWYRGGVRTVLAALADELALRAEHPHLPPLSIELIGILSRTEYK